MNITYRGRTYRVTTEADLLCLLAALHTVHTFACGTAA
jgi:hypothetical protein